MDGPSSMRALGQRQRGFVATVRDLITLPLQLIRTCIIIRQTMNSKRVKFDSDVTKNETIEKALKEVAAALATPDVSLIKGKELDELISRCVALKQEIDDNKTVLTYKNAYNREVSYVRVRQSKS